MSDGPFPDRLAQLRARWEADPSSRIFLQLAEEYRHQGRVKEALTVLEKGLQEHPGYLSALVAKGRCLLELGDSQGARSVLERVVQQDATQMVANKLLVRAYTETGDAGRARERLDLYSLLNDSDPEIEELRRRVKALERPSPPAAAPSLDDPFGDLAAAPRRRDAEPDVFDLGAPAAPAPPAAPVPASVEPLQAATVPAASEPEAAALSDIASDGDLFPGLATQDSRRRYLAGLAAEGIFFDELAAEESSVISSALAAAAAATPTILIAPPAPVEEPEIEAVPFALEAEEPVAAWSEPSPEPEPFPFEPFPTEPFAVEPIEEAAAPSPPPPVFQEAAEPAATATLGELYLRQGHSREAERMFREVLEREPGNAAALAGLEQARNVEPSDRPLDAAQLLEGFDGDGAGRASGPNARKIFLLTRYLQRLRPGSQPHVS